MAIIGSPVEVMVATPPRGAGAQDGQTFQAQSCRGSFAWGGSPGTATLVYVGIDAPVTVGAMVNFRIGNHYFAGLCKSDTEVNGTTGTLRTLEFIDYREFLAWDYIFGCFNKADVRLVNGVRLKRWKHMYPADYGTYKWTFTNAPLLGWEILQAILQAPTVGTPWMWDLTSNGLFPGGLLNAPVYDIDCLNGMRLDAVLNLISEKTGLVFCHDPIDTGFLNSDFRLVWTRKGYGLLPLPFPANSDEQRLGASLSGHATNICVLGDRNKYQVLGVEMVKDWTVAWEQFLEVDLLVKDIYDNEINPLNGVRYNAYAAGNAGGADPEHWKGAGAAKARALVITVGEYVALRNARSGDGAQFTDTRKFAGRWRTDLQAALYIDKLLFRAFKPNISGVVNKAGKLVPLTAAEIADQLLCRVFYDPLTGDMTADTSQPVDGNGVLIAKGYQVGEDLFRLVKPDRMNVNFFDPDQALWAPVNFQIDDSGEGVRFVIADGPVFVGSSDPAHRLLAEVDGKVVLNAAFQLVTPPMKAALVFDAERFQYWKGTYPNVSRDRVENVSGLMQEWLVSEAGAYTEIVYANNQTGNQKADEIADALLLAQYIYYTGGYNLKWNPKVSVTEFGTPLAPWNSSCLDRIEIQNGPNGCVEVVDFTTERQRDRFEPERELDRKSIQNSLFPGQQELRVQAEDQKRFNAAVRKMDPKLFTLFRKLLRGEIDGNLLTTKFAAGSEPPATLPVGTPIWGNSPKVATDPSLVAEPDKNFLGVTVRHNEGTAWEFPVQSSGDTLALVQGPVAANNPIGFTDGSDFETAGAYLVNGGTPVVGTAQEAISDTAIKTIKVRLGAGGGGSSVGHIRGEYISTGDYLTDDEVVVASGANAGAYGCVKDNPGSANPPWVGGGWWIKLSGGSTLGQWM